MKTTLKRRDVLVGGAALGAVPRPSDGGATNPVEPAAMLHIQRRRRIRLHAPVDQVFPLFTPLGEKAWAEGWDPEFLNPASGETRDGMVFRTTHGREETLWACVLWEPESHRVRYVRVTPGSRFGFVDVSCDQVGSRESQADVAYTLTALSPAGNSYLTGMTDVAFAEMIDGWKDRLEEVLRRQVALPAA